MPEDLLGEIIAPGWRVETVGEILSTNRLAAERAEAGEPAGYAVVANHQAAGQGRRGNRWESPAGSSLLLSALFRPSAPLSHWPRLAVAAAIAVCRAISTTTHLHPMIKWPNDILIDGCKVAGILLESRAPVAGNHGWLVVGIGINVHTREFPLTLRYPATSLLLAAGHAPSRGELAAALLQALGEEAAAALSAGWENSLRAFAARDALDGRRLRAEQYGQIIEGVAAGLDPEGSLRVHPCDGGPTVVLRDAHGITLLDSRGGG